MKIFLWAGLSAGSAAVASLAVTRALLNAEIWMGMLAPLAVVSVSWIMIVRTYRRHPERLTSMMMTAFGAKALIVGAYFWFALGVLHLRAVPFAVSFAAYFIGLYAAEALSLRGLFAERMRGA